MAHIAPDRVREFSTSTGTGDFTLTGAVTSFRAFSSVASVNDTFYYTIAALGLNEWEVGIGTYVSTNTISRNTIIASSNAGSAVNFSTGDKDVFITAPGSKFLQMDNAGSYGNFTAGTITASLSGNASTVTNGVYTSRTISTTSPLSGGGDLSANRTLSLASGYGDTQNPYASKTANFVLAAPNGAAGVPTFRAIVAADIPTLNQNTTGSAATLTTARTLTIGSTGKTFNGSADVSWSLAEIGAAAASHNHTSLTGVTSIGFAAEASDTASISTTISSTSTFFDFNLTDDNNNDWWRWRFTPSGSTVYDAMTLKPSANGVADLTVAGALVTSSTVKIGGTNATSSESVLLQFQAGGGSDYLGSIRTYNAGSYNQHTRFYTSNVTGTPETFAFCYDHLGRVGVGTMTPNYTLEVNGSFAATTKSFVIDHPTKPGKRLRYGSLEGPENGVYVRGRLKGKVIELPDYWTKLVDPDSITVQLTPIGKHQKLYVEDIRDNKVYIANDGLFAGEINCFYYVLAERCDVEKLEVEIE